MSAVQQFRKSFQLLNQDVIRWFPGHMGKGLRQMQQKLKIVDCVIEVHDARIPFSGRNVDFKHTVSGLKPHILVLNKQDLSEKRTFRKVTEQIQKEEGIDHVIFTNCKDQQCPGIRRLMPLAQDLILSSDRFNRTDLKEYNVMIIGVPNVGKSSLTNILRNRHLNKKAASAVGGIAGITRSVLTRIKICADPLVYLFDTPGILSPRIKNVESGMKLALCSCLKDHLVGPDIIADYLLYYLNRKGHYKYVELMGLNEPSDKITEVLIQGASSLNKTKKLKHFDGSIVIRPDLIASAHFFIKAFRNGDLGKFNLDE